MTRTEDLLTSKQALEAAIKVVGGNKSAFKSANISPQMVYGWLRIGHIPWSDVQGKTQYAEEILSVLISNSPDSCRMNELVERELTIEDFHNIPIQN